MEQSLHSQGKWNPFNEVVKEYLDLEHAELVPKQDFLKPASSIYYLPMHTVYTSSSTTTKLRVIFDASAKSQNGMSLNETLMVGPTIYPTLVDILIRFRCNSIALAADISKMYRAV